jgi:alpha-tubulin suppressor-like RCC1 family protein
LTKLLAKTLLCFFVSTTALGCNLILDNDDPFLLDAATEEPVDATKGPKSPDAGDNPPATDGATGDTRAADANTADRDDAGIADHAVPPPDAPRPDHADDVTPPPSDTTTTPDVTTPPPDTTTSDTTTPDVTAPPFDVTLDPTTSNDGPTPGTDGGVRPDAAYDGATPLDVEEAGTIDVTPPKVDAQDGCTLNPCGGCAELSGVPGAACGSCGTLECNADKNGLNCDNDPGLNACNGCGPLAGAPGARCGTCGTFACNADKTSVNCNNDTGLNACGGCTPLSGTPGAKCGTCGTFACNTDKNSVNCNNDTGLNACGGCGVLTGVPGAKCGLCGAYVCSTDKATLTCDHPDPAGIKQLAAGGEFTCALLTNGGIRCWGRNDEGVLGDNTTVSTTSPPLVNAVSNISDITSISAGGATVCALRSGGTARCWGANGSGQLGTGTTTNIANLMGPDVALSGVKAITTTGATTCALLSDKTVRCWGAGDLGELGDGTTSVYRATPDVPVVGLTNGAAVSGTCALLDTTGMVCWGGNGGGTLGDGTGMSSSVPVNVLGLTNVISMGAGSSHACAIASDGVHCWGFNAFGQCGEGRQLRTLYEPSMSVLTNAKSVGVGAMHTCALLNSGFVRCWGENSSGAVGDGTTTTERIEPVAVAGLSGVASLTVGGVHNCALRDSGEIYCWGGNGFGQLGDGTFDNRFTPVNIGWICP